MALRYGGNSSPRWLSLIVKAKTCRDERGSLLPGLKELPVNVEVPPPPPPPLPYSQRFFLSRCELAYMALTRVTGSRGSAII